MSGVSSWGVLFYDISHAKSDGLVKVILNLSKLNNSVGHHHFKLDTMKDAIHLMRPGCSFASIAFRHGYYLGFIVPKNRV